MSTRSTMTNKTGKLARRAKIACLAGLAGAATAAATPALADSTIRELYRGPRATAMGGAFVAVADDEQAVFLNPAGMAGVTRPRFELAPVMIEAPSDILTTFASDLASFKQFNASTLNALYGKNLYFHTQATPTFLMPNFGVAVITDQQIAFNAKNRAMPNFTVGYQTTNGIQGASGFTLPLRNPRNEVRVGMGFKVLWRRGGYKQIPLTDLMPPDKSILTKVQGEWGRGMGIDLGVQDIFKINSRLSLMAGAAWTELGDITFSSGSDTQKGNLSAGLAVRYKLPLSSIILAYDYRHMLDEMDPRLRHHLGAEISIPFCSVYAGFSEGRLTYGAGVDFWLLKLMAVKYTEELGPLFKQDPQGRYMIRLSLGIGL